jgi:hypothetical protein
MSSGFFRERACLYHDTPLWVAFCARSRKGRADA